MRRNLLFTKKFILFTVLLLLLGLAACGPSDPPPPTNTPEPAAAPPQQTETDATDEVARPPVITADGEMQWNAPPPMIIDPNTVYLATFRTEKGDIVVELFADRAPVTVNNLVFLAREGFYDGTIFHRVLEGFMAQGGDPTGTGMGGPGYRFADEIVSNLTFDEAGLLAMANSGPATNGSQFFITFEPTPWLDGRHTIFGKVVEGMDVLMSLTRRDPQMDPNAPADVLETVIIEEIAQSFLPPPLPTPVPRIPALVDDRPLADIPFLQRENLFDRPPAMTIDPNGAYQATIVTNQGVIVIELDAANAAEAVNNFYVLANLGYFDQFPVVYTEPDFFVLTGSPAGNPASDVGYALPDEPSGEVVMGGVGYFLNANTGATSGSQFFILLGDRPDMAGYFTMFGRVIEGMEIAQALTMDDIIERIDVERVD
jgi:cyclophilin family peptidyl-prolyl cis-trans isomerase